MKVSLSNTAITQGFFLHDGMSNGDLDPGIYLPLIKKKTQVGIKIKVGILELQLLVIYYHRVALYISIIYTYIYIYIYSIYLCLLPVFFLFNI